jgi:hypothetical protein
MGVRQILFAAMNCMTGIYQHLCHTRVLFWMLEFRFHHTMVGRCVGIAWMLLLRKRSLCLQELCFWSLGLCLGDTFVFVVVLLLELFSVPVVRDMCRQQRVHISSRCSIFCHAFGKYLAREHSRIHYVCDVTCSQVLQPASGWGAFPTLRVGYVK